MNTVFRVLVVSLLALACVKLHEIAQHTRLAGVALAVIAMSPEPEPTPRTRPPSNPTQVVEVNR